MFTRILFGTDFTADAIDAEREISDLAAAMDASVVVLHAIEPIDPGGEQEPFEEFYESLRAAAEEKMAAIERRFEDRGIRCETRVSIGPRWREILEQADESGADLIVLGSRPRTEPLTPGTTSHKVFWGAQIPVLFVRRPPHRSA